MCTFQFFFYIFFLSINFWRDTMLTATLSSFLSYCLVGCLCLCSSLRNTYSWIIRWFILFLLQVTTHSSMTPRKLNILLKRTFLRRHHSSYHLPLLGIIWFSCLFVCIMRMLHKTGPTSQFFTAIFPLYFFECNSHYVLFLLLDIWETT